MNFAACPECGAEYPIFHSPIGSLDTLCDDCGWTSTATTNPAAEYELELAAKRNRDLAILADRFHPRHRPWFDAAIIERHWAAQTRAEQLAGSTWDELLT